jgi:hypothetical protein
VRSNDTPDECGGWTAAIGLLHAAFIERHITTSAMGVTIIPTGGSTAIKSKRTITTGAVREQKSKSFNNCLNNRVSIVHME